MFKSKVFVKAMLIVASALSLYTIGLYTFVIPKINDSIRTLEETNAHNTLLQVKALVQNYYKDLNSYKKLALNTHKQELKNLTQTALFFVKTNYEKSSDINIEHSIKKSAEEFQKSLNDFYNANKNRMDEKTLKETIISYIRAYRYNDGIGYFFVNDFNATAIINPIKPSVEGKNFKNIQDANGVFYVNEMIKIVKEQSFGTLKYQWKNPKTQKVEDKLSYVFNFKPYNWIIGTGEYYSTVKKQLQDKVIKYISKLRYGDDNYFYISDYKSHLIAHPYLRGVDMSQIKDIKGDLIVPPMVQIAREHGEGFYSYWWKKNKKETTPYEKLTFAKNFPNWKMVIGTGVYIDEIQREVQKRKNQLMAQLKEIVKNTKIGKTGYLYIFDGHANMLIHPNSNINKKNFATLKNPTTPNSIFDDLLKASKTTKELYYKWDKPSDKGHYIYNKVSWIEYLPDLDWYIVSSAYVDEFKGSSKEISYFIFVFASLVFFLSALYSFFLFKNLLTPIINISKYAAMGEMISIIAHQWRQPLNELGLILQKFEFAHEKNLLTKEFIDKETKAGKNILHKMSNTIDVFKNFLTLRTKNELFDITESIENVIVLFEETCKRNNIKIITHLNEVKKVDAYQDEFEQALLNILNNAKDILIEKDVTKKVITIDTQCVKSKFHIVICDSGGGIVHENFERLFHPHFTTKQDNAGIGLYISQLILEDHMQGKLSVKNKTFKAENQEYYGACFIIEL